MHERQGNQKPVRQGKETLHGRGIEIALDLQSIGIASSRAEQEERKKGTPGKGPHDQLGIGDAGDACRQEPAPQVSRVEEHKGQGDKEIVAPSPRTGSALLRAPQPGRPRREERQGDQKGKVDAKGGTPNGAQNTNASSGCLGGCRLGGFARGSF